MQRFALFGPNLIDIEGKSTLSLLIDEVRPQVPVAWALYSTTV